LDPDSKAGEYLFEISPKVWTKHKLGMGWLKDFDHVTQSEVTATFAYRLLIIDGHDSQITLEFVRHWDEVNIKPNCLLPHGTHLLQPLDVGLFSPLEKAYGKAVLSDNTIFVFYDREGKFSAIASLGSRRNIY